jgi:isocitrate/isopropylmalate dehydrogenase
MYRKPLTIGATLETLKENEMAARLETAIARAIKEGRVRTYDMGGKDSTLDVAKEIANYATS